MRRNYLETEKRTGTYLIGQRRYFSVFRSFPALPHPTAKLVSHNCKTPAPRLVRGLGWSLQSRDLVKWGRGRTTYLVQRTRYNKKTTNSS